MAQQHTHAAGSGKTSRPADEPSPIERADKRIHPLPDDSWDRMGTPARHSLGPWVLGMLAVATFFALIHLAERDTDTASRMARINADLDAADARLQRAAEQLCKAEAGPGAEVLWTQDGDLVCRPAVLTAQADGGAR